MGTRVSAADFRPFRMNPVPDLRPFAAQIMQRVDALSMPITESGCWIWLDRTDKGYATTNFQGKTWKVHRLVYAALKGSFSSGLVICHECDVRCCVNPNHLRADTQLNNMLEASRHKRWGAVQHQETCKRGHPYEPQTANRSRECRICSNLTHRELYHRRKALGLVGANALREIKPRNPKRVRMIEYGGERLCVLDWSIKLGISSSGLSLRIRKHGVQRAIEMGGKQK